MSVTWVVDKHILSKSERHDEIISHLGSNYKTHIIEFDRICNHLPDDLTVNNDYQCGIIYGSVQFNEYYGRQSCLQPGSYYERSKYELSNYLLSIPRDAYINSKGFFVPYGMLKNNPTMYANLLGDNILFIRPNSGKKLFTGQVIDANDIEQFYTLEALSSVNLNTLVYVSTAKTITEEHRYLVVDKEVVGFSQYMKNGEIYITEDSSDICHRFAADLANKIDFDSAYVLDVGLCNNEPYVVELNCITSSAWYYADVCNVIDKLSQSAHREFKENCEDDN